MSCYCRLCRFCGKMTKGGRVLCPQCRRPSPTTLRCTDCFIVKPIDSFYKSSEKFDGRRGKCKECYNRKRRGEPHTYVKQALRIVSLAVLKQAKRDLGSQKDKIRRSAQTFLDDEKLVRMWCIGADIRDSNYIQSCRLFQEEECKSR